MRKQVDASHYRFESYMNLPRWSTLWHQIHELEKLAPKSALEVGPGAGYFKCMAGMLGIHVETVDIDPDLRPDHIANVMSLPFADASYQVVCAFQVLEHLPFASAIAALDELGRVASSHILISLPDSRRSWRFLVHFPRIGEKSFLLDRPQLTVPRHAFDGQHYWEINKAGYDLKTVTAAFLESGRLRLEKTFRPFEYPYHRFFLFSVGRGK